MTRKKMLEKLHMITVKVHLTILPSEGAIECRYMTSEGYKFEWIGIVDWPAQIIENSEGSVYVLKVGGKKRKYKRYKNFERSFRENWIGEVIPWEDCCDEELEEWLEMASDCEGIPIL